MNVPDWLSPPLDAVERLPVIERRVIAQSWGEPVVRRKAPTEVTSRQAELVELVRKFPGRTRRELAKLDGSKDIHSLCSLLLKLRLIRTEGKGYGRVRYYA